MTELDDFRTILEQSHKRLFRFLLASLGDRDVAENLTQECFLKAYKARASFQGRAQVTTWLMAIATNLVRDHFRSRRLTFWRHIQHGSIQLTDISDWLPDQGRSAEEMVVLRERVRAIWRAVSALPVSQRTVFLLRFVEEFDLNEIVQTTGMSQSKVKYQLHRALSAVRQELGAPV